MRNLLIFITKYNAFFLFLIFEISSLLIYIKYNSFQKATFINSTNKVTGTLYTQVSQFYGYLSLKEVNDSLARENASLRGQLKSAFYIDSVEKRKVVDTVYKQQYTYIVARVINNSTNKRSNYITINRGSKEGIAKDMGVICSSGVVGLVVDVSEHLAIVQSVLNKNTRLSAMLANNKEIGSFIWGTDLDPKKGLLIDIQNDAQPKLGEQVVTSGYSLFPTGIPFGKITNLHAKGGGLLLNVDVTLAVDFSKLEYVYVVNNKFASEQAGLEAGQKKNE
ncbi:rod shape-determining protein MreC [Mucilaginibacter lappiensis]|uniref:Cell shape-determining protein MreC n=1 Tax=Mucilaginibacter lappiensis TaxID=354630 RepID=A0A841JDE8_9SPHI|nr:rod shape-determining protein MreC [Mucilaginibacter lappiensis]MBB6129169.1 rod shape-determining protein MreC [Mucilaginibacter lappiensis]